MVRRQRITIMNSSSLKPTSSVAGPSLDSYAALITPWGKVITLAEAPRNGIVVRADRLVYQQSRTNSYVFDRHGGSLPSLAGDWLDLHHVERSMTTP